MAPRAWTMVALGGGLGATACSLVEKFVFSNKCSKDIQLESWNQVIPAGQTVTISALATEAQRIGWKYVDGEQYDFIELNSDWAGPGQAICSHPSYSNYNGFSMPSKYEALKVDGSGYACDMPGAAITCGPFEGPCSPGNGYLCKGSADCRSSYAQWMRNTCARAINSDGTLTPTFKDTTFGVNYPDFWCAATHDLIGTMIDCVDRGIPIMLKVTTCDVQPQPGPQPSPTPAPEPSPTPSPSTGWRPCGPQSKACCNPYTAPLEFCPGQIMCQTCGGSKACECPQSILV